MPEATIERRGETAGEPETAVIAGFEVAMWPLRRITPYSRNARKIPESAIAKVAASIKEFGWRQPIVVDPDGVIVAGHTRLLAAQRLELADAPVHVAAGLTPQQIKALRLMDNRSHEEAKWDYELLALELGELESVFDLSLTGFEDFEIAPLLSANWSPEGRHQETAENARQINLTPEQWTAVAEAIERLRDRERNTTLTEGAALSSICGEWQP